MVDGPLRDMFKETINSSLGSYEITDSYELLINLDTENTIIFCDQNLSIPEQLLKFNKVLRVDGSEALKTLESAQKIIIDLANLGANRSTHLIAIGGGSVQDICTFICSIYMRGIAWSYIPSTLMAMLDSCIGGKSSINVGDLKNLVGNFYLNVMLLLGITLLVLTIKLLTLDF